MQGTLARKLRVIRAQKGLTLRQAASELSVTPGTLSELERGLRHPHDPTLAKIAKGYGVSFEELLEEPSLAGKGEAPATGQAATQRPGELPPSSPELPEKSEDRPWQRMSEEQKQAHRHEHDWTRILSGAFERILEEEKKHINEDWTTYPKPERVRETYSLLNQFEKAGGTQGSKRLEELIGLIQKVLTSIDRMDLHKDDPVTTEEERHLGRFSKPGPDERAFSQNDADVYQVDEANQDAR